MNDEYKKWISTNSTQPLGRCVELTVAMAAEFPELTRTRGHYLCPIWGDREHWWLVDTNNTIVDPTDAQFPSLGHGENVSWEEGNEEPVGKCGNCGGYSYPSQGGNSSFCGDDCAGSYENYLNA